MNFKLPFFLLFFVLVTGIVAYYASKVPVPSQVGFSSSGSESGTPVLDKLQWTMVSISRIEIERDGKTEAINLNGSDWSQVEPVHVKLNAWNVQNILDAATALKSYGPAGVSLKDAGLDSVDKATTITLVHDGEGKLKKVIHLGKITGFGGDAYATIDDDKTVMKVNNSLHTLLLNERIEDWRQRILPEPPTEGQATHLTLTNHGSGGASSQIDLIKIDNHWTIKSNHDDRADAGAVAELMSGLRSVNIMKYVSDNPKDLSVYGLDKPSLVLAIESNVLNAVAGDTPSKQTCSLIIGAPCDLSGDSYFALYNKQGDPQQLVVTIGKMDEIKFNKTVKSFRDPRLTILPKDDVSQLKVARKTASFTVKRGAKGWELAGQTQGNAVSEGGFALEDPLVNKLLEAIASASADDYVESPAPANEPAVTLELTAIGHATPDTIRLFDGPDKKHYLVYRNQETTGYLVPIPALALVLKPSGAFRSLTLLDQKSINLTRVKLDRSNPTNPIESVAFEFEKTSPVGGPEIWKMNGQDAFEMIALEGTLGNLLPLKAEKWEDARSTTARPWTVMLTSRDGKTTVLHISPIDRSVAIDGIDFGTVTPILPEKSVRNLGLEFRRRTLISLSSSEIEKVTITPILDPSDPAATGLSATLSRDSAGIFIDSTGRKVEQVAAGKLFDTLGGLQVEHYIDAPKPASKPTRTLLLETRNGQKLKLEFPAADGLDDSTGRLGDRAFTLSPASVKKLTGDVFKIVAPMDIDPNDAAEEQHMK